ncbi:hypothetical protein [Aureimonas sp. AU20]|uniref:hypothetical protein n=1 Tax=Aureimonas sp. AU20 TaxID=1349819 RepID=UPI00071EFFF5|nr:hypothetical protein [Aureimonas sp. AU20]ALN75736.1 hypothetical protein M673_23580 [Aureimonas sp. AU20]
MAEDWLTYSELGERLGVSSEAARQKSMRLRLRKQSGNDGKVRVWVDWQDVAASTTARKSKDDETDETADEQAYDERTIAALEAHIESLREAVQRGETAFHAERARADDERARADRERDRADAERGRVDELLRRVADLATGAVQQADNDRRTGEDLARLRAELEQMQRPWWKRLVG